MYKVLKARGFSATVTVENTEKKTNITIGKVTMDMVNLIKEAGYKLASPQEEWDVEVNKDTAEALSKMAMKMRKPIRDQRKPETKKQANKQIDAMDVMLGLANYS